MHLLILRLLSVPPWIQAASPSVALTVFPHEAVCAEWDTVTGGQSVPLAPSGRWEARWSCPHQTSIWS